MCKEIGLRPSKLFGQNYLINRGVIQKILDGAELQSTDTIVEVGPGFGVLTLGLSPLVKKIISFEIEQKLTNYWKQTLEEYKNIEIVWGDILTCFDAYQKELGSYKVVANLPYQITGKVIPLFLQANNPPISMTIMVQKEVAQRICASKGEMSVLAVAVQYFGNPTVLTYVAAGSFFPPPKVDSAVVHIANISHKKNAQQFFGIVKAGFANKRKQLWKNLDTAGYDGKQVKEVLVNIGATSTARAQELSVAQWENLVDFLVKKV